MEHIRNNLDFSESDTDDNDETIELQSLQAGASSHRANRQNLPLVPNADLRNRSQLSDDDETIELQSLQAGASPHRANRQNLPLVPNADLRNRSQLSDDTVENIVVCSCTFAVLAGAMVLFMILVTAPYLLDGSWRGSCGIQLNQPTAKSQYLSIPQPDSSRNEYRHNLRCEWHLNALTPFRIRIDFEAFNTEACCDYLQIKEDGIVMREIRGYQPYVNPYVSKKGLLTLIFHSNGYISKSGFRLRYKKTCENNLQVRDWFQSLSFPDLHVSTIYEYTHVRYWCLDVVKPGQRILIEFESFDIEQCCEYLQIMESGEQKRTISGNVSMPEIYISEGEDIVLLFYSDAPVTGEGFSLRYRQICSSFYFASNRSRRLSNPAQFGLESYSNNENRRWCLNAMDPGRRVFIEFEIFHSELCCDYLEVIENGTVRFKMRGHYSFPKKYTSESGYVVLLFHSDYDKTDKGFRLHFRPLFRERKMCNLRAVFVGDKKRVYEREETDRDLLFDECYQQYRL